MPHIEFTSDVTVRDGSGTHYAKGQVIELSERSALHWLNRQVARIVDAPAQPVKTAQKPPKIIRNTPDTES